MQYAGKLSTTVDLIYAGKLLPKVRRAQCYREGRLPESERTAELPGHGALMHSTTVHVASSSRITHYGDTMRRLNNMFAKVDKSEMPVVSRGRAAKDLSADPVFVALKGLPVDADNYVTDGKEYTEDAGRKMQSKIALYAKAGAGTFRTSFRAGKVYILKIDAEYKQQRGEAAA